MNHFIRFFGTTIVLAACLWCYCGAERDPPQFVIDLDTPPRKRWDAIYATLLKDREYVDIFTDVMLGIQDDLANANCTEECINRLHASYKNKFPDYYEELLGIYDLIPFLNLTLPQFVASQLEIEINMLFIPDESSSSDGMAQDGERYGRHGTYGCTSVVTCDAKKNVLFGRNLEWGDGPTLAKLMFIVNFTRNNTVLFQTHQVPGHLGILSGSRINGYSIALNARVVEHNPTVDQFLDCMDAVPLQPIITGFRYYLEYFDNYKDIFKNLTNTYYCMPRYTILGGPDGKGVRLQHNFTDESKNYTANYTPCVFGEELQCSDHSWFVAEANSDLNVPVSIDTRRGLVMDKLKDEGRSVGATVDGLYEAMTIKGVRLVDTVFTSIMSPVDGIITTVAFDTSGSPDIFNAYPFFVCLLVVICWCLSF